MGIKIIIRNLINRSGYDIVKSLPKIKEKLTNVDPIYLNILNH
jgi:hypothetical protein